MDLATIIAEVGVKTNSEAENEWIRRIESLRSDLEASSEELETVDFGAGSPESHLTDAEMYQGKLTRRSLGRISSTNGTKAPKALVLFRVIRCLKPGLCVELGTSVGISACYQAAALKLNGAGRLITLEGSDAIASIARRNFGLLGLDNIDLICGRFQDTLSVVLSSRASIDYVFIDGHHDRIATLRYFEMFISVLTNNAVMIFDDIRWSEGMEFAWETIRQHKQVSESIDLKSMGVVVMNH